FVGGGWTNDDQMGDVAAMNINSADLTLQLHWPTSFVTLVTPWSLRRALRARPPTAKYRRWASWSAVGLPHDLATLPDKSNELFLLYIPGRIQHILVLIG
ncbi:hypothetical protein THAOC_06081, partial [Thalassiosira oceanica]